MNHSNCVSKRKSKVSHWFHHVLSCVLVWQSLSCSTDLDQSRHLIPTVHFVEPFLYGGVIWPSVIASLLSSLNEHFRVFEYGVLRNSEELFTHWREQPTGKNCCATVRFKVSHCLTVTWDHISARTIKDASMTWITLMLERPRWCRVKNTLGMLVYSREWLSNFVDNLWTK